MTTGEEDHDPLERALIESLEKDEEVPLDLYTACLIGDFITVRQLIQSGSELDRKNKNGGWTPLMYAAYVGRDTIVNLLLEAGADVKIGTPKTGTTALMLASACGNESIAYFLLQVRYRLSFVWCFQPMYYCCVLSRGAKLGLHSIKRCRARSFIASCPCYVNK